MTLRLLTVVIVVEAALVAWLLLAQLGYAVAGRRQQRHERDRTSARAALIEAVVTDHVGVSVVEQLGGLEPGDRDDVLCQVAVEVRSQNDPVFSEIANAVGADDRIDRDLCSRRWWVRRAALRRARALGLAPARGIELLADPDPRVRATAATWAAAVGPVPEPAAAIIPMLADPEDRVRHAAMTSLHALGSSAQPALLAAVQVAQGEQLRSVLATAVALGDPVLAAAIRRFVRHPDPAIQAEAIRAVAPVMGNEDTDLVAELLDHEDPRVRAAAAQAAGAARLQGAAGALARSLGSDHGETREAAITALEEIGPSGDLLLRRAARAVEAARG